MTAVGALAIAAGCWAAGAGSGWLLPRRSVGTWLGAGGALAGAFAAGIAGIQALTAPGPHSWHAPWNVPAGGLALRLDPLAAVFLLPLAVVGGLCTVYGVAYLRGHAHGFAAFNLLLLSMALVVTANDLVLFLVAWELMTVSSWALVVNDHEAPAVRAAGLQYLVAGHLATAALLLLALLLGAGSGTFEIAAPSTPAAVAPGLLFGLAVIGFGTKAGIVPLHVWLPDAHSAAPSHVSAVMSAIMITMGFYGLARFLPLFGPPAPWWGYLLMSLGAVGAVGGVALANAQSDVKRVLAYSTVENAGLVTLAVGMGLLATAQGHPALAGLAWTGALLHLWNHAIAKALLFLGFGAVAQRAGSRSLDALGGMLRAWPVVGGTLVLGAAAMAGLPGLNVFASEWLLVRGLLLGAVAGQGVVQVAFLGGVVAVALTGGLAVAGFARLVGVGLAGTARSAGAASAPRPGPAIVLPLVTFAAACGIMAIIPARLATVLGAAVALVAPGAELAAAPAALDPLVWLVPLLAAAAAILYLARGGARRRVPLHQDATWGCAYPAPTAAMQYTSASFAEPLTRVLQPLLRTEVRASADPGWGGATLWPRTAHWTSRTADRALAGLYLPFFAAVARVGQRLRAYHQARVTWSLLYIGATVLAMLALLFLPGMRP